MKKEDIKVIVELDTKDNYKVLQTLNNIKKIVYLNASSYETYNYSFNCKESEWSFNNDAITEKKKNQWNLQYNNILCIEVNNGIPKGFFISKKDLIDEVMTSEEYTNLEIIYKLTDIIKKYYTCYNFKSKYSNKIIIDSEYNIKEWNQDSCSDKVIIINEDVKQLGIRDKYQDFNIHDDKYQHIFKLFQTSKDSLYFNNQGGPSFGRILKYKNLCDDYGNFAGYQIDNDTIILMNKIMSIFSTYKPKDTIYEIYEDIYYNRYELIGNSEYMGLSYGILTMLDIDPKKIELSLNELIMNKDKLMKVYNYRNTINRFHELYQSRLKKANIKLKDIYNEYNYLMNYNKNDRCLSPENNFKLTIVHDQSNSLTETSFKTKFKKFMGVEECFIDLVEDDVNFKVSGNIKLKYSEFKSKINEFIKKEISILDAEISNIITEFNEMYPEFDNEDGLLDFILEENLL